MSTKMKSFFKEQHDLDIIVCVLSCAAFMTGSLPIGAVTGKIITLILITYLLWNRISNKKTIILRMVLSAASIAGIALLGFPSQLSVLVAACFALSYFNSQKQKQIYHVLVLVSISIFIFFTVLYSNELVRRLVDTAASILSSIGGRIIGRVISVGPTYMGIQLVVIVLIYISVMLIFNHRKLTRSTAILIFISPFVCCIVYGAVWSILSELPIYNNSISSFEPLIAPFDYRIILFILLLLPVLWMNGKINGFDKRHKSEESSQAGKSNKMQIILCVVLILFASSAAILPGIYTRNSNKSGTITFYDSSRSPLMLQRPEPDKYGLENVGMFGMLPDYLKAAGYSVYFTDSPKVTELKNTDVFVIINLMESLKPEEEEAIWEYVKGGGKLLVLGDHTGTNQIREPFNQLLRPVGISFNFDSAIPFKDLWRQGYTFMQHPVLNGLDWHEIQINIGASLDIEYPAHALITGKYGFSDNGNINNIKDGYLGDMKFNRGERLGDIILAAEAEYGEGGVIVFGDTSPLQVVNLPYSYNFINRLFQWLSTYSKLPSIPVDIICIVLWSASSFIIYTLKNRAKILFFIVPFIIILSIVMQVLLAPAVGTGYTGRLVGIDMTHNNLVKTNRDKHSIDGLAANIERNGFIPLFIRESRDYEAFKYEALIIIAPSIPIDEDEIERLKLYMENGGIVIIAAGWREYHGCQNLLETFGLCLQNIPLGRGNITGDDSKAQFWEAWAISINDTSNTQVIATLWGYPTATFTSCGKGGLVLIGDSQFFEGKNLEDIRYFNKTNIDFIKEIFCTHVNKD